MRKIHFITIAILIVAFVASFRGLFTGAISQGDAPFFYTQGLAELLVEPTAWTSRGINLGGINSFLWISPLMLVYGFFGKVLLMPNDTILQILFYFPSIVLSFTGGIALTRLLKLGRTVQIFTGFFLVLNTYFLLLVDGGQVGISLAYGLFPWFVFCLRKHLLTGKFLLFTIFVSLLSCLADPRIFLIGFAVTIFWWILENGFQGLVRLLPIVVIVLAANLYWILPLFSFGQGTSLAPSELKLLSLLNGITFYQPHWYANEFGKVTQPEFYFVLLPILVLLGINLKKRSDVALLFVVLICIFFLKGETAPAGGIYRWLVSSVPLGSAFRDSSKFFIPLMLFGGILMARGVDLLASRFGKIILPIVSIAIIFLVYQAPLGKLPLVLSGKEVSKDYQVIYEKLGNQNEFFRTIWFPEKHPKGFATDQNPALDGRYLVSLSPLAFLNTGGDVLNFVNNPKFAEWFQVLGVKYLIVDKDPRRVENKDDQKNRQTLLSLLSSNQNYEKVEWGTQSSVFQAKENQPHMWGVEKLLAVVGGQDVYQELENLPGEFNLKNQAVAFFEDGLFDPKVLGGTSSQSTVLVFNNKSKTDLTLSFLQDSFKDPSVVVKSQWAQGSPGDYLAWKYELLIRKLNFSDSFYNRSIAYSSNPNEKISIPLSVPKKGKYHLVVRAINLAKEDDLIVSIANQQWNAKKSVEGEFQWTVIQDLNLESGEQLLEITNKAGLKVLNAVALITPEQWSEAERQTQVYLTHFPTVDLSNPADKSELANILSTLSTHDIVFTQRAATRFKVQADPNIWWVMFTDSFHPLWKIRKGEDYRKSVPSYSMVNAFYLDQKSSDQEIVFEGQGILRWGFYWTAVATLACVIALLYRSLHERSRNH